MHNKNQKDFIKNIGIVTIGPTTAFILSFLAEPWLARFWEPKVFGSGAYFFSIIMIISTVAFLRYNFAIVQAQNKEEEHNLFGLCILIMIAFMVLMIPVLMLLGKFGSKEFAFDKYILFVIVSMFFASFAALFKYWYSAQKKFSAVSFAAVIQSLSVTILLLVFGILKQTDEDMMIYIRTITFVIFPLVLFIVYFKSDFMTAVKTIKLSRMKLVAKKYSNYPKFEYWGFLASVLALNLPIMFIAKFWGQTNTGLYAKAFNLMYIFVIILGDSINRVLHKETADLVSRNEDMTDFLNNVTMTMIKYTILPYTIFVLIGPELFSIILGTKWELSGRFSQYIAIWMFSSIINLAIIPLYGVLNRQKQYTIFQVLTLAIRTLILVLMGYYQADIVLSIAVLSLSNFIVLSINTLYILHVAGVAVYKLLKSIMKTFVQLLPFIVIITCLKLLTKLNHLNLIVICCLLSLPYLYLFYIHKSVVAQMVLSGITGRIRMFSNKSHL